MVARSTRAAVRHDARRRRLGAAPDESLPGGVRLHPVATAGRRVRGVAGPARAGDARRGRGAAGRVAAEVRPAQRGGPAARAGRDQPGCVDREPQPRPLRDDWQGRLVLLGRVVR